MITLKHLTIVLILSLLTINSFAQIREFETTRLQSTSGAGVATILVNEASVLNPAPIVFVPVSSFYYQKGSSSFSPNERLSDGTSQMYLLSDSTSAIKGTFSYQDHSENNTRRRRFTSSLAAPVGKQTSFGLLYRYTMDDLADRTEDKFHQAVFGFTHVHSEQLIIGGVLVDPFLSNKSDSRAILGFQYALVSNVFLIADTGINFHEKENKSTFTKTAIQISFFKDLYLRVGQYHDQITMLKGKSWGVSWIGPRLSLEYAYKTSEAISSKNLYFKTNEEIIENSLSIALVF